MGLTLTLTPNLTLTPRRASPSWERASCLRMSSRRRSSSTITTTPSPTRRAHPKQPSPSPTLWSWAATRCDRGCNSPMWSRLQQPDVIEAATLSVQASLTKPADLNPPEKGQAEFEKKFGLSWKSVRRHWLTYIERAGGVPARHTHQGLPYEGSTLGLPGLAYTRTPSRGLHGLPYTRTTVLARFRPCLLTFTCLLTCSLLTRLATSLALTLVRSYALTFLLAGPRRGPGLQRRGRL